MQLEITFLGTGGSWPTVKRNVPAVAIKRGLTVEKVHRGRFKNQG